MPFFSLFSLSSLFPVPLCFSPTQRNAISPVSPASSPPPPSPPSSFNDHVSANVHVMDPVPNGRARSLASSSSSFSSSFSSSASSSSASTFISSSFSSSFSSLSMATAPSSASRDQAYFDRTRVCVPDASSSALLPPFIARHCNPPHMKQEFSGGRLGLEFNVILFIKRCAFGGVCVASRLLSFFSSSQFYRRVLLLTRHTSCISIFTVRVCMFFGCLCMSICMFV